MAQCNFQNEELAGLASDLSIIGHETGAERSRCRRRWHLEIPCGRDLHDPVQAE